MRSSIVKRSLPRFPEQLVQPTFSSCLSILTSNKDFISMYYNIFQWNKLLLRVSYHPEWPLYKLELSCFNMAFFFWFSTLFFSSLLSSCDGGNIHTTESWKGACDVLLSSSRRKSWTLVSFFTFVSCKNGVCIPQRKKFLKGSQNEKQFKEGLQKVSLQLCDVQAYHEEIVLDARFSFVFSINRKKIHCPFFTKSSNSGNLLL